MADPPQPTTSAHSHLCHRPRLVRYAASILHDDARAEDAVQDVMCRLVEKREEAPSRAWLYAAVRNRCIDLLRKEGRMTAVADLDQTHVSPGADDPAAMAMQHDDAASALAALDRLPASQRDVLRLRFAGNLSYAEIADATGKSVNHVGVLIHEGLKTLRRQLGAEVTQ